MKPFARRVSALVTAALALVTIPSLAPAQPWSLRAPLPPPTGAHAVGTDVLHIVDSSRATSRSIRTRPLTVQRWYPARRGTGLGLGAIAKPHIDRSEAEDAHEQADAFDAAQDAIPR